MANPSFQIDDEKLADLDEIIKQKKLNEEIDMDTSRSDILRDLVDDYIEGNRNCSETTIPAAD
jgi:metal-responsive CopG/Arc/MetJ family transcriptional regulator